MLVGGKRVALQGKAGTGKSFFTSQPPSYLRGQGLEVTYPFYGKAFGYGSGAEREGNRLVSELLSAKRGERRPVLIDDADGLWMKLSKNLPYLSPDFLKLEEVVSDPTKMDEYVEKLAGDKFDTSSITREHFGRLFSNQLSLRTDHTRDLKGDIEDKFPSNARGYYKKEKERLIRDDIVSIQQSARVLWELHSAIELEHAVAFLVLNTPHQYPSIYPDTALFESFGWRIAPYLEIVENPDAYTPDDARLYLQKHKGVRDREIADIVIETTGGVHSIMDLALRGPNESLPPLYIPVQPLGVASLSNMNRERLAQALNAKAEEIRKFMNRN